MTETEGDSQEVRTRKLEESSVVQALQKVDRRCILHLTPQEDDQVRLILLPTALSSVAAYAALPKSYWFDGYRIESQSGNNIGVEVDLQNLDRALKSASGGDEVVIKLAKKGVPVLTFDIRTALGPILQDLPVSIMSSTRLEECREADSATLPGVVLPSLANLCSVVERLKALGNLASIKTVVGERSSFSIEASSDAANLSASYEGLEVDPSSSTGEDRESKVELEVKNFGKALFAHQILPDQVLCYLLRNNVLVKVSAEAVQINYHGMRKSAWQRKILQPLLLASMDVMGVRENSDEPIPEYLKTLKRRL